MGQAEAKCGQNAAKFQSFGTEEDMVVGWSKNVAAVEYEVTTLCDSDCVQNSMMRFVAAVCVSGFRCLWMNSRWNSRRAL